MHTNPTSQLKYVSNFSEQISLNHTKSFPIHTKPITVIPSVFQPHAYFKFIRARQNLLQKCYFLTIFIWIWLTNCLMIDPFKCLRICLLYCQKICLIKCLKMSPIKCIKMCLINNLYEVISISS